MTAPRKPKNTGDSLLPEGTPPPRVAILLIGLIWAVCISLAGVILDVLLGDGLGALTICAVGLGVFMVLAPWVPPTRAGFRAGLYSKTADAGLTSPSNEEETS